MPEWTEKDFETYTRSDWELIKKVKQLTDENLDNIKVLTHANEIALAIFGMLCTRLHDSGEEGGGWTRYVTTRIYRNRTR